MTLVSGKGVKDSFWTISDLDTYITIQIRRTDFVKDYAHMINSVSENYLQSAIKVYAETFLSAVFVVVSDDIEWCEQNLPRIAKQKYYFSTDNSACEDFSLMVHANHSIVTAGSSFGWWGAYLANGHATYFPNWLKNGRWGALKLKVEDFYLPRWTLIPR